MRFVTDPIDRTVLGFLGNTLTWESARPYLCLRTRDGRLLVGGEDDRTGIPARRDRRVESKALGDRIERRLPLQRRQVAEDPARAVEPLLL
jgi:hypothetical protein